MLNSFQLDQALRDVMEDLIRCIPSDEDKRRLVLELRGLVNEAEVNGTSVMND